MKNIIIKIENQRVEGNLYAGCYKTFPNGSVKGTAYLLNGHAVRVSKSAKSSVYKFQGLVS